MDYITNAFTIINSDHIINNNNIYIYSQHPYCCVNNIVKQGWFGRRLLVGLVRGMCDRIS